MDKPESAAARQHRFAEENNRIADRLEADYPEIAAAYRQTARKHECCARGLSILYLIETGKRNGKP